MSPSSISSVTMTVHSALQSGHRGLVVNQRLMQLGWNAWTSEHGNTATVSLGSNSTKQMTHSLGALTAARFFTAHGASNLFAAKSVRATSLRTSSEIGADAS